MQQPASLKCRLRSRAYGQWLGLLLACLLLGSVLASVRSVGAACTAAIVTDVVSTSPVGTEALAIQVTLRGEANVPGGDALTRVAFTQATNGVVEVDGRPLTLPTVQTLPPGTRTWAFTLRKVTPGAPFLVAFVATDLCGEVPRFAGWGAGAASTPAASTTPSPTSTPGPTPAPPATLTSTPTPTPTVPIGPRPPLSAVRLINYYPANNAQTNLWTHWDPAVIDADFARIAALHANTVRIALFPDIFGYPVPTATMLGRLDQLLQIADRHGLSIQLVLLGWWTDYADVAGVQGWSSAVLAPHRNDPRIAFIDVRNEIDVDSAAALTWARGYLPWLRTVVGSIPLTVSVSGASGTAGLQKLQAAGTPVDFYDLHYYGLPEHALSTFTRARAIVGSTPLLIGEYGYSTMPTSRTTTGPDSQTWWEAYQDQYHRTVQEAARASGLPAPGPWILNDFVTGAFPPWSGVASDPAEYAYGLYRTDGTAKPAAGSVAAAFAGQSLDLSFNNGFEQADASGRAENWSTWQSSAATFARDPAVAHTGTASGRISASTVTAIGLPSFSVHPVKSVRSGASYTASVWVRGQDATGLTCLSLAWFDAEGRYLATTSSASLPGGNSEWTLLSVTASAPPGADAVEIDLVSANNDGTAWFDDVTFD